MSDCRRGTGAHCNCDDALVALLVNRLTTDELATLDRAHSEAVLHSIAEALARKRRNVPSYVIADQTWRSR